MPTRTTGLSGETTCTAYASARCSGSRAIRVSEGHVVGNGRRYSNRYISVLTLREGEVAHWRDYLDPVAVFDALGWSPR
jgi:ketosteroid isomerase-like protein